MISLRSSLARLASPVFWAGLLASALVIPSVLNYKYLFITLSREGGARAMDFFEDDFAFCLPNVAFGLKIAVRQIAFD